MIMSHFVVSIAEPAFANSAGLYKRSVSGSRLVFGFVRTNTEITDDRFDGAAERPG